MSCHLHQTYKKNTHTNCQSRYLATFIPHTHTLTHTHKLSEDSQQVSLLNCETFAKLSALPRPHLTSFYFKRCNSRDTDIEPSVITICCYCTGRQICELWLQKQLAERKVNFVHLHLKWRRKIYLTERESVGCCNVLYCVWPNVLGANGNG